jgi:hypothetical protein
MIPLTLALSLQGRRDYSWFFPLEGRLRRLVRTQADSPRRAEERGGLGEGEISILF